MKLEAQRKDKDRQEEEELSEELNILNAENVKEIFFIWVGMVNF